MTFLDLTLWIDVTVKNESCTIDCVVIKDLDDTDYNILSRMLFQDLEQYYKKNSIYRTEVYNNAVALKYEQSDAYNIRPKMPSKYYVNTQHFNSIKLICEDEDRKIKLFLKCGFAGTKIKLKKSTQNTQLVKTILPLIKEQYFPQVNYMSYNRDIADFIHANFTNNDKSDLNIRTLRNNITRFF